MGSNRAGPWGRKIHEGLFRRWYLAGMKMSTIAFKFGCTVESLKALRRKMGLPARRPGRPSGTARVPQEPRMDLAPGDLVVLTDPENPTFYGMPAWVEEPTPWGAHLRVPVFHHGGPSTRVPYRATFAEMRLYRPAPEEAPEPPAKSHGIHPDRPQTVAVAAGYTGDCCAKCGGSRMTRAGACLVCADCGETTGCG